MMAAAQVLSFSRSNRKRMPVYLNTTRSALCMGLLGLPSSPALSQIGHGPAGWPSTSAAWA